MKGTPFPSVRSHVKASCQTPVGYAFQKLNLTWVENMPIWVLGQIVLKCYLTQFHLPIRLRMLAQDQVGVPELAFPADP